MTHPLQTDLFDLPMGPPNPLPAGVQWRIVNTASQPIGFTLKRSRRRSIGLVIDDAELRVTAPSWSTLAQIDECIRQRAPWIISKLRERQLFLSQQRTLDRIWSDGGHIPYLGRQITLALGHTKTTELVPPGTGSDAACTHLKVALPVDADMQRVQDHVHAWLQQQARHVLQQRLDYYLHKSGQTLQGWTLSSAKTRWGSCTSARRIRLNWRLIHFEQALMDYVVAHEVAHLIEMNHSEAFWQVVRQLMPDFQQAKARLRQFRPGVMPFLGGHAP